MTLKPTLTLSPSSSIELDLADPDAGDPDLVVDLQPAGLGELGVVGVAAADQRQVGGPEGGQDQQRDHGQADRPDDDGVALAERDAHPRSHLAAPVLYVGMLTVSTLPGSVTCALNSHR